MTILRRIRLDFSPAYFGLLALWAGAEVCETLSSGKVPWSVESAYQVGLFSASSWWIWSDSVRRKYPLQPVWGSIYALFGGAVLLIYLFRSRGRWGFLTLFLYTLSFMIVSFTLTFLFG